LSQRDIYEGFDYSTFDLVALRRLELYKKPPTYQVSTHWGCGCFLDPPGYPTHFLRSVYTQYGNSPSRGATEVVDYKGELYVTRHEEDWKRIPSSVEPGKAWDYMSAKHDRLMRRIWKPLPLDHERVRLWQIHAYCYFKNCYSLDGDERNVDKMVNFGPDQFHLGYLMIRKYYPEAEPHVEWSQLEGYGRNSLGIGDWIDMEAVRPTPETCWPDNSRMRGSGGNGHPMNGKWCQWCGWYEGSQEARP
jgi:hypothetical protein